jgi:ankyrin repeat protein
MPNKPDDSLNMHAEIIKLGIKLGYFKSPEGVCQGVTMAWLSACLTDENQAEIYKRITTEITENGQRLFDQIKTMKDKVARNEALTPEDKKLSQYLAFYEQITLYMYPERYDCIFDRHLIQENIEEISNIANSVPLVEKGGLFVPYTELSIFTQDELIAFLSKIAESVSSDTGTIAFLLNSHNHAIGLTYNPSNGSWQFMDINEGEPQTLDIANLAKKVLDGFNVDPTLIPRPLYTGIYTRLIAAEKLSKRASLITNFQQLKRKHLVSEEFAKSPGAVSLLWFAARVGYSEIVNAYLDKGAYVNKSMRDGITHLSIAAQNGHMAVVQALLDKNADVNLASTGGLTPLFNAAKNGHVAIVLALLDKNAAINQATTDGATPLFIAAQYGYTAVVRALLDKNANVNQAMTDGTTPLFIAAQNGHMAVVQALLDKNANVNQAMTDGTTALYVAAQNGHTEIVQKLLRKNADVNLARTIGLTPLMIATRNGHKDIVRLLKEASLSRLTAPKGLVTLFKVEPEKRINTDTDAKYSWINYFKSYFR